jgi:multiple sugar transport system permease protein
VSPAARAVLRDALVLGVLALYATPFFWQALTSFKPEGELLRLPPLLPSELTLDHYRVVFTRSPLPKALGNSIGIAVATTALVLALALPAAYALARLPVRGRRALLLAIVASTAFPQIATVSPLYLLLRAAGLRDTWTALILGHTALALPLTIWLLSSFIREIPEALEEAAAIDGAGKLATLRWVIGPLVAPGAASAALLAFLASWNEFLYAYTFSATEASRTVPVALALFPGVFEVPWGDIAAASMLASIPTVLVVVLLQRHLIRGLTAGAVKD